MLDLISSCLDHKSKEFFVLFPWLEKLVYLFPIHLIGLKVLEKSVKSSCLHLVFGPLFTPYPLFEWGLQSKEVLLNLGMKCWSSGHLMNKVRGNYRSCTCRNSENICSSSSGGAQERGNQNRTKTPFGTKMVHFWVSPGPIIMIDQWGNTHRKSDPIYYTLVCRCTPLLCLLWATAN